MRDRRSRDAATESEGQRRRWPAILGTLSVLGLAGAVAARTVDLETALGAASRADPALIAAAGVAYLASWPLRGRRYGDVLAPMDRRLDSGFLTLAVLLSQTANLALPARAGDAVRAYVCKRRRSVPYASGAASLTVERCFDLLALAAIGGVALGVLLATGGTDGGAVLAALRGSTPELGERAAALAGIAATGAGLAAITAIVGLAVGTPAVARRSSLVRSVVAERWPSVAGLGERVVAAARAVATDCSAVATRPRSLAVVGVGSLAIWLLDAATAVLVLAAVSAAPVQSLVVVGALAVAAGNLAKVLPLTQGGLGLYEGAFAATVVALSPVGGAVALAAAVIDHALKNGVTLVGGAIAGSLLGVSPRTAPVPESGRSES